MLKLYVIKKRTESNLYWFSYNCVSLTRSGAAGQGREEMHVLSENSVQDVWDERLRHQTEAGVDHRSDSDWSLISWRDFALIRLTVSVIAAIQTAIRLHMEGKNSLHKDLKLKRREQREQREKRRQAKEEELQRLRALQEERERKLAELELLKEAQKQAQVLLEEDEQRRRQQHEQLQQALEIQLREAEEVSVGAGEAAFQNGEDATFTSFFFFFFFLSFFLRRPGSACRQRWLWKRRRRRGRRRGSGSWRRCRSAWRRRCSRRLKPGWTKRPSALLRLGTVNPPHTHRCTHSYISAW